MIYVLLLYPITLQRFADLRLGRALAVEFLSGANGVRFVVVFAVLDDVLGEAKALRFEGCFGVLIVAAGIITAGEPVFVAGEGFRL